MAVLTAIDTAICVLLGGHGTIARLCPSLQHAYAPH